MPDKTSDKTRLQKMLREARRQQAQIKRIQNSRHLTPRRLAASRLAANGPFAAVGDLAADENRCLWVYVDDTWQEFMCIHAGEASAGVEGFILLTSFTNFYPSGDEAYMVWKMGWDGVPTRLTPDASLQDFHPCWNKDYTMVAVCSMAGGVGFPTSSFTRNNNTQNLVVMDADGSNRTTLDTGPGGSKIFGRFLFSDDGSKLAYVNLKSNADDLYVIDIDGGTPTFIRSGIEVPAGFSADGSEVYYYAWDTESFNKKNSDGTGSETIVLNSTILQDAWYYRLSPDKTKVLASYFGFEDVTEGLKIFDIETGDYTHLAPDASCAVASWAPDGTKVCALDYDLPKIRPFVINADGTNKVVMDVDAIDISIETEWPPTFDGLSEKVVFQYDLDFAYGIMRGDAVTGEVTILEEADEDQSSINDIPFNPEQVVSNYEFTSYDTRELG